MTIQRILVPTDFSENAEHALAYAISLAKAFGAEIHLLHAPVVPTYLLMDLSYSPGPEVVTRIHDEAENALRGRVGAIEAAGLEHVETLREGTAHEVIRDYAAEIDANLIVIGTHGRTGVAKLLYGSVTERVVKTATTPIIVVPHGAAPKPASLVIAYDFSAPANRAAELARTLHGKLPGSIHLVHTYLDVWAEYTDRGAVVGDAAERRREALARGLEEMLDEAAKELFSIDAQAVQCHLATGDPAEGILAVADEVGASLVCAGTTGKSGVERVLLGSVARRLLHESKVPILLTHEDD
ncbi:MAG: universal stress protein [Myxococcota bacterium]